MQIIFFTTSFPRFLGDYAGVFVYDIARFLAKETVSISILAPHTQHTPRSEYMSGVKIYRFSYFYPAHWQKFAYGAGIPTNLRQSWIARIQTPFFILAFLLQGIKFVKESEIIHAHWIESGLFGLLLSRLWKRPLVISVHRFNPIGKTGQIIYKWVLSKADYILFNSTYTQQRCLEFLAPKNYAIIPPGIDLDKFPSKWGNYAENISPVVFALGSLLPVKGFKYLVDAIPKVLEQHPHCKFIIGGQGPERASLLEQAKKIEVEDHLQLLGRVPTEDVPSLMSKADIFVLPSIPHTSGDTEALGMVLAEAMACGTPCVASRTGGIMDIVDDNVNGFLVSPKESTELADKIIFLLNSKSVRKKLGEAGRKKIEDSFSLDIIVHQIINIYGELLSEQ